MRVIVKYFGFDAVESSFPVELPEGSTARELLECLKECYGEEEQQLLDGATLMINDASAEPGTTLAEQDRILVLVPLGGG